MVSAELIVAAMHHVFSSANNAEGPQSCKSSNTANPASDIPHARALCARLPLRSQFFLEVVPAGSTLVAFGQPKLAIPQLGVKIRGLERHGINHNGRAVQFFGASLCPIHQAATQPLGLVIGMYPQNPDMKFSPICRADYTAMTWPKSRKAARTGVDERADATPALYSSRPRSIAAACCSVGSTINSMPGTVLAILTISLICRSAVAPLHCAH